MREVREIFDKDGKMIKKVVYEYDEQTGERKKIGEKSG